MFLFVFLQQLFSLRLTISLKVDLYKFNIQKYKTVIENAHDAWFPTILPKFNTVIHSQTIWLNVLTFFVLGINMKYLVICLQLTNQSLPIFIIIVDSVVAKLLYITNNPPTACRRNVWKQNNRSWRYDIEDTGYKNFYLFLK